MALDELYILDPTLENYFVDKDTGLPLDAGTIEFFKDNDRTVEKPVYQLNGAPPNYTYAAMPNPITLSAVGTIQDAGNDNVSIYFYPYDADGNVELYYMVVKNSAGVVQFTREAWPNIIAGANDPSDRGTPNNEITNSQFVEVLFNSPLTISVTGSGKDVVQIAPGWRIEVSHTGAGTVTVTRNLVAGSSAYVSNPPYTLTVVGGANISAIEIIQSLTNNPGIWAPAVSEEKGYVASCILLADGSSADIIYRQISAGSTIGTPQTLLSATNNSGAFFLFKQTEQLVPSTNTGNASGAYVDIVISLPPSTTTTFSSVQVVGMDADLQDFPYEQQPANRQRDFMSHYYKPQLAYKPIPSYLIGWDFPLNPAQLGATQAASAIGPNKSKYVWDQTIIFQSANTSVGITRDSSYGSLKITASGATQAALIQYLDQPTARKILNDKAAFFMRAKTDNTGNAITGVVSLWATTDGSLPNVASGTNNSLIATIDSAGKPATFNGAWTEVARSGLGNGSFSLTNTFSDVNIAGWDGGAGLATTATYFAIVIGFASLADTKTIDVLSASLCPGNIATPPAPQTVSQVLFDCSRYFGKSFLTGTTPAQAVGVNTGETIFVIGPATSGVGFTSGSIPFKTEMRATPNITLYNPINANAEAVLEIGIPADLSSTATFNVSKNQFGVNGQQTTTSTSMLAAGIHWTADARLGIV